MFISKYLRRKSFLPDNFPLGKRNLPVLRIKLNENSCFSDMEITIRIILFTIVNDNILNELNEHLMGKESLSKIGYIH